MKRHIKILTLVLLIELGVITAWSTVALTWNGTMNMLWNPATHGNLNEPLIVYTPFDVFIGDPMEITKLQMERKTLKAKYEVMKTLK